MGQGSDGAAAAQEKLKPDEQLETTHEKSDFDSRDRAGNRVDSDIDSAISIRQRAELVGQEERHAQVGDSVFGIGGNPDLPGVQSGDGMVSSGVANPAPQVAGATEPDHATGGVIEDERHKWGPNVTAFPGNATRGTPQVAQSANRYTSNQLPEIKWFTFERRKASTNTWAYCVRWYKLDHATGKYERVPPICVRRVSDATDTVLKRRDTATLKKLVRQWYEEKTGQQFVSAS